MATPNNKTNQKGVNINNDLQSEETVFRRKEDKIKYEITNKVIGVVKWLIFLNLLLLYFFYSVTKDNKILVEYQMKMINDISQKISKNYTNNKADVVTSNNVMNHNYNKVFETSQNANKCASCHNTDMNVLFVRSIWNFEDFRKYVRGKIRIPSNNIMPNYTEKDITTKELEAIYFELTKK